MSVNVPTMVRSAGTPVVTYGVECVWLTGYHLNTTWRNMGRAAAPEGYSKQLDMVRVAWDGNKGTMDPAFERHVLPLQILTMAW